MNFKSKPEELFAELLVEKKTKFGYEPRKYDVLITTKTSYRPDFKLELNNGKSVMVETKGPHRFVKPSLIKLQHFVEQHPDIPIIMVGSDIDKDIPRWKSKSLRTFCQMIDIPIFQIFDVKNGEYVKNIKEINKLFKTIKSYE